MNARENAELVLNYVSDETSLGRAARRAAEDVLEQPDWSRRDVEKLLVDLDNLRIALEAERHVHRKDNEYLVEQRELARAAIAGLLEIAETAMPDTYFATDSRVEAARKWLDG